MEIDLGFGRHPFSIQEVGIFLLKVETLEPVKILLPILQLTAGFLTFKLELCNSYG